MISVVILTKNEEQDLPSCLESLHWCDDIFILDSGSADKTTEIAEQYGASVFLNKFEGFGTQRNFALDRFNFKYDWVLFLDADEQSTDKFQSAMFQAVQHAGSGVAGFYACSQLMLGDTWLRRSDTFPKWQFRLLRKGMARYYNLGHGQKECAIDGDIRYIKEPYLHYGISKGWHKWIERHNWYSTKEAELRFHNRPPFQTIFVRHPSIRNVALKCWLSRYSWWPFFRFFHAYILKMGFLEGTEGFLYCVNNFYYEFMIRIKYRELEKIESLKSRLTEQDYQTAPARSLHALRDHL
jgi:glycosyltransferase involved in cell wall biosynthesis